MTGESLRDARDAIIAAKRVAVFTGAGISAESGIPTFRGAGGFWGNYRPEDLATPEAFARDPRFVWEWYDWRRGLVRAAAPNPGHKALATFEKRHGNLTLITQNVDGLHERAGSENVLRLHGSLWIIRCMLCGKSREDERTPLPELPPVCSCGGMERPGVVWFGEALPTDVWDAAADAVADANVLLVVGTSAVVYPAASLIPLARSVGAKVIEVNTEQTDASVEADFSLRGAAGELLPSLLI